MLGWGAWDSAPFVALQDDHALLPGTLTSDGYSVVTRPANIADLAGTVSYRSAQSTGVDASGAALRQVAMAFDLDLAGGPGAISNGQLLVLDNSHGLWRAAFAGEMTNAAAVMTNITGSSGTGAPLSGSIQSVFTGTGMLPDFYTGFVLRAGDSFVKGFTILTPDCHACR
jgi:hypothetical protein